MNTYKKIDAMGHMLIWFFCACLIGIVIESLNLSAEPGAITIWFFGFLTIGLLTALALGVWGRRTLKALNLRHHEKKLHPYAIVSLAFMALSFIQEGYIVYLYFHSPMEFTQYAILNRTVEMIFNLAALLTLLMSLHKAPVTGTHKGLGIGMSAFIFGFAGSSFGLAVNAVVLIFALFAGVLSLDKLDNYFIFVQGVSIISTLIIAAFLTNALKIYRDYAIYQSV